jgi:hypothetical protein
VQGQEWALLYKKVVSDVAIKPKELGSGGYPTIHSLTFALIKCLSSSHSLRSHEHLHIGREVETISKDITVVQPEFSHQIRKHMAVHNY